jgi:hypothetical protein
MHVDKPVLPGVLLLCSVLEKTVGPAPITKGHRNEPVSIAAFG